jgi:hypothetical protein
MSERIKGVFIWEAHEGQEAEFVRRWKMDSDVIQTYPGALGTMLHPPIVGSRFFIGYASWESLEHRDRAMALKKIEHPELDLPENSDSAVSNFINGYIVREPDVFSNPPVINIGPTPAESYTHPPVLSPTSSNSNP